MTIPEIIETIETLELDHEPHGWPAVRMDFLIAAKEKLQECESVLRDLALNLSVGGYNSLEFCPNKYYDKITWGIDEYAKSYHQAQKDIEAAK